MGRDVGVTPREVGPREEPCLVPIGDGFVAERRPGGEIAIRHPSGGLHMAGVVESAMVQEIDRLRGENERLSSALSNPVLTGIHIDRDCLDVGLQGAGAQLLAGMFLGLLERHPDAANYVECRFDSHQGPVLVTVMRPGGKTPHELRMQAERELQRLLASSCGTEPA